MLSKPANCGSGKPGRERRHYAYTTSLDGGRTTPSRSPPPSGGRCGCVVSKEYGRFRPGDFPESLFRGFHWGSCGIAHSYQDPPGSPGPAVQRPHRSLAHDVVPGHVAHRLCRPLPPQTPPHLTGRSLMLWAFFSNTRYLS